MSAEWRDRFSLAARSGPGGPRTSGWEFTAADGTPVWTVSRDDSGAFPVFSAARGEAPPPPRDQRLDMTATAVGELLATAGLADDGGWHTRNLAAALSWAGEDIVGWEGEEWALVESGPEAPVWASPAEGRVPFFWLRALLADGLLEVGVYQDDAVFGLDFTDRVPHELPAQDVGSRRFRRQISLARGPIEAVDLAYDTTVAGKYWAGLVTEVLLHARTEQLLLVAADAYGVDEWHLYDESVVAIPDPQRADAMAWIPARCPWRAPQRPAGD